MPLWGFLMAWVTAIVFAVIWVAVAVLIITTHPVLSDLMNYTATIGLLWWFWRTET